MNKRITSLPFLISLAMPALAAPAIEEVIVTGELRDTNVLQLANSVSVISEELITARNAKNLEDLLNLAPNVNFSSGASRGRFIQIRGIGERSQFSAPINPSVGIIVDGIDLTGIATGVTALDTQQVEIFRGPQGTLYGANALAGMINVVGNKPTDEFYGKFSLGAGNYNSFDIGLTLSAPVTDTLGWRFSALQNQSDGYIHDAYLNRDDTNNIDEFSARNHFSFIAGEHTNLDLITYYIDVDNGYDAFSLDNNRTTYSDEPGRDTQKTFANALHINHTGLDVADVNLVVSHADSEIEYSYDEDWSFTNICAVDSDCAFFQYSTNDNYQRDNKNSSADIRFLSKGSEKTISWVAGVYYREQDVDLLRLYTNNFPDDDPYTFVAPEIFPSSSTYETKNIALYSQLSFALSDAFNLITGLRFEEFTADFADSDNARFSPKDEFWGGKVALEYTTVNNNLIYALISRGYKAAGFNIDPDIEEDQKTFDAETMVNYEVGTKGHWLDGALTLQLSAFYQQRNDIQVKQSSATPSASGFEFTDFLDNAAKGVNYGIEFETLWKLNHHISLFASMGLLEAEFNDFINLSHVDRNTTTGEGYDLSGRDQAHAPAYQYLIGTQFNINTPLYVRIELEGKDRFYFSESHNEQSESYDLLNMRIGYDFNAISIAIWGKNLSDELVETRGFYFSNDFGNDPRKLYSPEPYTQKGAPRTFGITASIEF